MRHAAALAALALLAVAAPAAAQDDPLRIAVYEADGNLSAYSTERLYELSGLVYDTLLLRDAEGRARPWLAREVRRDGARRIRVVLQPRARWHDGRPVTAADVAFTFAFLRRRPHPRYTGQLRDLRAVRVLGPRSLLLELRRPSLGFEDAPLADVPIMPRHLWRDLPLDRLSPPGLPVGSGPYRLVGRRPDGGYRFTANRRFWGPRPTVPRIDVHVAATGGDALADLRDGDLDVVPVSGRPQLAEARASGRVELPREETYDVTALAFDRSRPPFDRPAARQAVARALDLDRLARATGAGDLVRAAQRGLVHPASPWSADTALQRQDLPAARIAFAEQGIGPFPVLHTAEDEAVAEALVRQLRGAGARAGAVPVTPARAQRALARGGFGLALVRLPALVSYDPAFLRTLLASRRSPLAAVRADARAARLADALGAAPTAAGRRAASRRLLRHLATDLPVLPLFFGGGAYALDRSAHDGWVDVPGTGTVQKRSFLAGARAAGARPPAAARSPIDEAPREPPSLLPVVAGLAGLVVLAVAGRLALVARRRR